MRADTVIPQVTELSTKRAFALVAIIIGTWGIAARWISNSRLIIDIEQFSKSEVGLVAILGSVVFGLVYITCARSSLQKRIVITTLSLLLAVSLYRARQIPTLHYNGGPFSALIEHSHRA